MRYWLRNADRVFIGGSFVGRYDILVENGRIARIEPSSAQVTRDGDFDLSGKTLLPALWDVHVHFFQTGIRAVEFDAGGFTEEEALFSGIELWLADHRGVNGYGFSPPDDGALPTRSRLDAISRDKPIFIRRIDGHSSCANSRALAEFGSILADTKGFDFETGLLALEAQTIADRFMLSKMTERELRESAKAVANSALMAGCANIGALVPNARWLGILLETELPIKVLPRLETLLPEEAVAIGVERVGGCMPMVDGAFGSRTALLSEPYSDMPDCFGASEITQLELNRWFFEAGTLGLSTATHAIGDAAVDMILQSVRRTRGMRPKCVRIEHAELLRDDQIDEIAKLGISLAVQPVFESIWGGPEGMYSRRLGERWRSTNRFRDLLDAGVPLAGSSDSYITPIDPLAGVRAAVRHPNRRQAVSLDEAIEMFSTMSAIVEGEADDRGDIAVGKAADFAVVEGECLSETSEVVATIVNGKIEFGGING